MLDPFWESKDLITPEEYNRFAGPTVVLARLPGRVFTLGDTVRVKVDVAHFGAAGGGSAWNGCCAGCGRR